MIIEYFENKYGLSHESSKNLIKGILSTVALDIVLMLPMGLYVLLIYILIKPLTSGEYMQPNLGFFILLIIVVAGLICIVHWKEYYYVYNTTMIPALKKESA